MHLDITAHVPFRKCRGMNNTFGNTKYVGLYLFHKKIFFKNQKDYGKKKRWQSQYYLFKQILPN